jgi:2-hydroxyglutarate dehydrogenase
MLYALCEKYSIPYQNMGKWIVAQTDQQFEALVNIHEFTSKLEGVPTNFIPLDRAAEEEPYVRAKTGILESPTTGIIDSHSYMQFLLGDFQDRGGDIALHSPVMAIKPLGQAGSQGWEITSLDDKTGESTTITSETLINSAGHGAPTINNMILPPSRHQTAYYAKGNYFSYSPSVPHTRHLIYPAPELGLGGLGTHLTLDLAGRIRFGPDVEWVDSPTDLAVNAARLPEALKEIKKYLPDVQEGAVVPDYAGIRPKLGKQGAVASGKGFVDFVIRREEGVHGFVNLLGIESPGLTSSLAIAAMVEGLLYR